jgi:hypothetical protein
VYTHTAVYMHCCGVVTPPVVQLDINAGEPLEVRLPRSSRKSLLMDTRDDVSHQGLPQQDRSTDYI